MKKLLTMILALATVFSLAACGDDGYTEDVEKDDASNAAPQETPAAPAPGDDLTDHQEIPETQPTVIVAEPNEEEQALLMDYQEAANNLTRYHNGETEELTWRSENGYYWEAHTTIEPNYYVLKSIYEIISGSAQLVDKYQDSEFGKALEANWNYQEMLSWFTVVEDVLVGCTEINYNALGESTSSYSENVFRYDAKGNELPLWKSSWYQIVSGLPVYNADVARLTLTHSYTYEYENGVVNKLTYMNGNNAAAVMTLTRGEYGITNCHILQANGTEYDVVYTYNEQGLLAKIETVGLYSNYYNAYEYNQQGQMIKAWDYDGETYEYSYDASGNLIGTKYYEVSKYSGEAYGHKNITFETDDQGRVLRAIIVEEGCTNEAKRVYEYTYGDYYVL